MFKTLLIAIALVPAGASAQITDPYARPYDSYAARVLPAQPYQPPVTVIVQPCPAWQQMLAQQPVTTPSDIVDAWNDGVRRGQCDRAVQAGNALGVQAYCR